MHKFIFLTFLFNSLFIFSQSQTVEDDFEGNGTITWEEDPTQLIFFDVAFPNQNIEGINTSATVLKYHDDGEQYANIRFDTPANFDLSTNHTFSLKIYIPSSGITGSQLNQISLKLQDGTIAQDWWATQSEIKKSITLDQWQVVTFDFENDTYINLDPGSLPPTQRTDFNRIVLQVNGENNTDHVLAYIDDFLYDGTIDVPVNPVYDNLVWSDEFDGNGAINSNKWFHQTQLIAGNSWANNEVQHYTNRTDNSYVSGGTLKLVAKKESFTDQGHTKQYTSARLNSKFAFKYGRVEVRAKLPSVAGTWPAIWMLGKNINEAGGFWYNEGFGTNWPACGEIDIMEPNIAKTEILGTWHWNNGSGYQMNSAYVNKSNAETSQNFHNYILEWSPSEMKIYIDNTSINQMTTVNPFNEEFYILFNIAMGGSLGGTIDSNFTEDTMEIDYIRVYQESTASVADENWFEDVLLYPNPVKDNLTIKVPAHLLGAKATIYSLLGQELNSFVQKESTMNVNLSHYKKGVYILRFENNNKLATYKIFKM